MSFMHGYLTPRQRELWSLLIKKIKQKDIARILNITKQTVSKSVFIIEKKIARALYEAAKLNRIIIKRMEPLKGILLGYSPEFKTEVIIFLSPKYGLQIWYRIEHSCKDCYFYNECKKMLLDEIQLRGIKLREEEKSLEPSKLAELLFNHLLGED
ncbi:MAG: helix-turn-helix transcriptional regulator [Candidatus Njordarchaeales archaeon]